MDVGGEGGSREGESGIVVAGMETDGHNGGMMAGDGEVGCVLLWN